MLRKINWVALIKDNRWVVAKISRRKKSLKIHKLFEVTGEEELEAQFKSQDLVPPAEPPVQDKEKGQEYDTLEEKVDVRGIQHLKQKLKKEHIPLKKLKVAISCPGVITRIITLPLLTAKELEKLLTEHVDQYFTLNIEDYLIDYRSIDQFEEDGQKRQRILLAAIPKYQWEKFHKEWKEIGFVPKVVDLAVDSLTRLYSQVGWSNKAETQSTNSIPDFAIVDLGPDRVEIVLLEHGVFFLYSDFEVNLRGLEDYAKALKNVQSNTKKSEDEKVTVSQDSSLELNPLDLTESWAQSEMEGLLNPVLNALSDFFNFFSSRHYGKSVDSIFLTGYYSNIPLLTNVFEQVLEIETHFGFPEGWHPRFKKKSKVLQENWMKYGSLYGLALRED